MPDQGHYIHGDPLVAKPVRILSHTFPRDIQANTLGRRSRLIHSRTQQRGWRIAAVANDFCSNPLVDFTLSPGFNQQCNIRVGVRINEAWAQVQILCFDGSKFVL